jgi:hypothetical protein
MTVVVGRETNGLRIAKARLRLAATRTQRRIAMTLAPSAESAIPTKRTEIVSPDIEFTNEVRFAVVMYGGVSLAIYINGVAQGTSAVGEVDCRAIQRRPRLVAE